MIRVAAIRLWRYLRSRCLVCGRCDTGPYRYCTLECAAYDQALKDPGKSRILSGCVHARPKPHHEWRK